MNTPLLNTLEQNGETLAVCTNREKIRSIIATNLKSLAFLIGGGVYAWLIHSVIFAIILAVLSLLIVPLVLLVLWMEFHALRRTEPSIELGPNELRFVLNSAAPISLRAEEIARLEFMPSTYGQTLVVTPADEKAFRERVSWGTRFYMVFSNVYCGHAIGLTPNLNPEDFRRISQALDQAFPNRVATLQKAHRPSFVARLLGIKAHAAPLAVHVPPPLSKA